MSTPEALYQQKRMTAADAASLIRDGDTVYVTEAPFVQWNKTLGAITGSAAGVDSVATAASGL